MLLQLRISKPAYEILSGVLRYDDDILQAYIPLSAYHSLNGQYSEAIKVVNALLDKKPGDTKALQQRADVYTSMKQYDQAIVDLTYVLEYDRTQAAYFARGLCYFHKKIYNLALPDFEKAIKIKPDARSYNAVGKCLKEFGRDLEAIEAQKKALAMDPTYREAALDVAIGYMSQSMAKEALEYLNKTFAIDPDFVTAHGWQALLHDNMGRSKDVIEDVKRVMRYDPSQITS